MLKNTLDEIRKNLLDKELSIIRYGVQVDETKKSMELIELKTTTKINQEVDDKGKAIFTNDVKRKAELYERLGNDGEYINHETTLLKYKSRIATLLAEVQDLKLQFKTYEIISRTGEIR